jgi:hypothetical protein
MKHWRAFLAAAFAIVALSLASPGVATADHLGYYMASDSYYALDVPNGSMAVLVQATVQDADGRGELGEVYFFAMPGAKNVVAKRDGVELTTAVEGTGLAGNPLLITVTLDKPIKQKLTADLVLTYDVPPQSSQYVKIEPGAIESMFVSQGHGSFVLIDVPSDAENYIEPGCLVAADQPAEVSGAGKTRYVCGETLGIAIGTEDADLQARCARMDDACRQSWSDSPFWGFAQSITDPAKQLKLEETIELAAGPRTLTLLYFRSDRAWAEAQFAVAKAALPLLEANFGYPYPHDRILLRESTLLLEVALGIAFTAQGEMLITNTGEAGRAIGLDDREVTVHELAHQWAGLQLDHPWLWEGLAEWGMHSVAGQLGIPLYNRGWDQKGYTDPLATWYVTSPISDPDYWYGKAGAFWQAFESAVGGRANMTATLARMQGHGADDRLDGRWFQDRGEEVSNANLDELFLTWVYVRETATPLLAERRAAHDIVRPLKERAATMLLTGVPKDIQQNLDEWAFDPIAAQVAEANRILDEYAALLARAAQDGGVGVGIGERWNTLTMAEVRGVVDQMRQALDAMDEAAQHLTESVDDPAGREQLERAREYFLQGDFAEAKRLAAGATSISFNKDAAAKLLAIAKERDAAFKPNFLQKIGLFSADPSGHVVAAEEAYEAGDYEKSLDELTTALNQWSDAQEKGLLRLSLLVGGMGAVAVAGWLLVRRLDKKRKRPVRLERGEGHVLAEPGERSGSWQEWLNQKD